MVIYCALILLYAVVPVLPAVDCCMLVGSVLGVALLALALVHSLELGVLHSLELGVRHADGHGFF